MANNVSVKVDTSKLTALLGDLGPEAEKVLDIGAFGMQGRWQKNIRNKNVIDTGAYLGSVHVVEEHKPFERIIADGVEYGVYQEYGTSKIAARPCATPAFEATRGPFLDAWRALFK